MCDVCAASVVCDMCGVVCDVCAASVVCDV